MDYTTQNHIRSRIAEMARSKHQQVRAQDLRIPEKEKPQFMAIFLFTAIILLAVATGLMMFGKHGSASQSIGSLPSEASVTPPSTQQPTQPTPQMSSMTARMTSLEDRMKIWQYRLWLLGLANNENVSQLRKMDADHHRIENRAFITVDSDWRLSKVPESMQLSDEQKQFIQQGGPK